MSSNTAAQPNGDSPVADTGDSPMNAPKEPLSLLANSLEKYLQTAYPYSLVGPDDVKGSFEKDSTSLLKTMSFFKIASCTIERTDQVSVFFQQKMRKLLAAAYSSEIAVCFGFIGQKDGISLVLGLDPYPHGNNGSAGSIRAIAQGILPGTSLEEFKIVSPGSPSVWGMMEAVPTVKIDDEKQKADYTGLLRSLNGREFNLLIMAHPVPRETIQKKITILRNCQTACSAMLKTNYGSQSGTAHTDGTNKTTANSTFSSHAVGVNAGGNVNFGIASAQIGGSFGYSWGRSETKSVSEMVSDTVSNSKSMGYEVQNFIARDIIDYCEDAVRRFRLALTGGGWDTCISYSATEESTLEIIQGYLFSEIAKPDPLKPQASFQTLSREDLPKIGLKSESCSLLIPNSFLEKEHLENKLAVPLNSEELGMLFAFPESSAPGFELREGKFYALSADAPGIDDCRIGKICDGEREIENAPFAFSRADINKHTFICGITGCGKTTSVKKILVELNKKEDMPVPFLVLECAKKEYRNLEVKGKNPTVYTPGHPEIHSPQMNPFYIQPGISLQTHIDFLKDLFNASFSFYGPMTYILETCLHRIYQDKGWNLTTGDHPLLVNSKSMLGRYDSEVLKDLYAVPEHRFLFPTMRDLLDEVNVYVNKELNYDSEISGNITGAMIARLEGLCIGAKGFMFNNLEPANMEELLSGNAVMELEGLSDDSDKAFVVGLLIVFINEYRQCKAAADGLKHVLVIEEAHRLLKNVETERVSESMGNPKGKAVEHFTNMLAEMRSYGQGVIIAEQIPSKIAPDVIKNSSNKIIHRLVSRDDQEFIANTIGVKPENALYFGVMKPGFALCHKEGMYTPVSVKVDRVQDKCVTDGAIRSKVLKDQTEAILLHQVKNHYAFLNLDLFVFKLLNSLLWLSSVCVESRKSGERSEDVLVIPEEAWRQYDTQIKTFNKAVRDEVEKCCMECRKGLSETPSVIRRAVANALAEKTVTKLSAGFYLVKALPKDLCKTLAEYFEYPIPDFLDSVLKSLRTVDPHASLAKETLAMIAIREHVIDKYDDSIPVQRRELAKAFFLVWDDACIDGISRFINNYYLNTKVK